MDNRKVGFWSLVGIAAGSMIASGVFSLPADMSSGASCGAVIIGWAITGIGMVALALVYQKLSERRPDLDSGVYSYAREGFGDYTGFNSAWGYWLSAWLGNVSYAVLLFSALGYFFPVFGSGNTAAAIIGAIIFIWFINMLILRGVKQAAFINLITFIGRLIPILIFIVALIVLFNVKTFNLDFWGKGNTDIGSIMTQVKSTMLITLWVFIGIEGAVAISGRAEKKSDVGKATITGFIGTLIIYVLITVLSFGILPRAELAELKTPSMAYLMEEMVGKWGAVVINIGLIISLLGATLGWTLLAAEIPYVAAKDGIMPKAFSKENKNGSPKSALIVTNILTTVFLLITLVSESTYQALYSISSTAILIPYLFSALYGIKLAVKGETYDTNPEGKGKDLFLSIVATVYSAWLIYAAGLTYLLMVTLLYALGIVFYIIAKKEKGDKVTFAGGEKVTVIIVTAAAILAVILMAMGKISPL